MAEKWISDPHVARDCAAKIAGQQDRAKNRGPWNQIENRTDEQHDANPNNGALRISHFNRGLYNDRRLNEFHNTVEQQERRG